MNVLFPILYLFTCVAGSNLLTRWCAIGSDPETGTLRVLAWTVCFFTSFFGGFYVLGYINLITNLPAVDSVYALVLALVVLLGVWLWLPQMPGLWIPAGSARRAPGSRVLFWLPGNGLSRSVAAGCILGLLLMAVMLSAGFPRGYEPQSYNLPIAVHIFQTHSLKIWTVWKTVFSHAFPANASLYFGFLFSFIPEHLVAPAGLVFLVPLTVALYGIGRATGADETASLLSALGLVTMPILLTPASEAGSDVGGVAFVAIAIYFALARPTGRLWDLVLSGLAAGLSFGFKSLHLVSIAFLTLTVLVQAWSKLKRNTAPESLRATIRPLSIFLACTFATSGFWLVRNYAQLGNPLYPVYLRIFKVFGWGNSDPLKYIFTTEQQYQYVRSSAEWLIYPWLEGVRLGGDFSHGLGPFFAATVPVSCLTALVGMLKRETGKWPITAALLGGAGFVLTAWWFLNARTPRYALGALVFLVPLVAWTMNQATGISRRVFEFIVVLCISSALLMTFTVALVEFGSRFIYGKQFARHAFYQYPQMIDRLPPGSTVINLGHRTRNYSLFGAANRNSIVVYAEALSALELRRPGPDEAFQTGHLAYPTLRKLGATHIFTEGHPEFTLDACVQLQKLDGLDKDDFGNALPNPLGVYEIKYCK